MSIPKELKDSFCVLPFNSLALAPFGSVRVCCNNYKLPEDASGKHIGFQYGPLDPLQALNNEFHKELRRDMLQGKRHESCHRCWDIEDHGGHSYRQGWNNTFRHLYDVYKNLTLPDGTLTGLHADYVEITLGNNCNLKCRMCNPWSSSSWIKEAEQLKLASEEQLKSLKNIDWFKQEHFLDSLKVVLKNTQRLNFLGGEPLYNKEHIDILKMCIDAGISEKIEIQYNSNITVLPEEVFDLWKKFKFVYLNISCDGYGELYNFVRFPGKWETFEKNLHKIISKTTPDKVELSIHCTFQALNVTQLDRLYSWVYQGLEGTPVVRIPFVIYVNYPTYLDPRVLPLSLKKQAYDAQKKFVDQISKNSLDGRELSWLGNMNSQIENLLKPLPENVEHELWQEFKAKTKALDGLRQQNIADYLPEIAKFID